MRSLAASLAVLCIAFGTSACGGSSSTSDDPREQAELEQPRPLADVWNDLLAQRDLVQGFVSVEEIWHEENDGIAAAMQAIETHLGEFGASLDAEAKIDSARRTGIDLEIGRLYQTVASVREITSVGAVGGLPRMMPSIDLAMQAIEQRFYPGELGPNSIASRAGFNPVLPPPPKSPI